jgi:hypothetical protein
MTESTGRPSTRLEPYSAWTVVTDSPLKGLSFAREAGTILAWDEGNQLYLLNVQGESLSFSRVPNRVNSAAISDDGSLIALLVEPEDSGLLLLNADFEVEYERAAPADSTFVTIDPHGRYLAVGSRQTTLHFFSRFGRPAGTLETMHSLSHLCFVAGRPMAVAAAAFGTIVGVAFEPGGTPGRLNPEIMWQDRLLSNVGRLAVDGEGGMILASCYTLGIQRFDLRGRNEGSYHLGGTVSHAVPDFPGRTIATATLENELAVINSAGNVRWRTALPRAVVALEVDPLGRYLIYGHSTGEIVRLDLFGGNQQRPAGSAAPRPAAASGQTTGSAAGSVRSPDWLIPVVETEQQSETAVITVVDDPPAIALFTSPHRLQLFDTKGKKLGQGPDLGGVGRILRTAPGWLAAATDRQIVLCDLRRNTMTRLDVSLVQLTHLAIKPDDFGIALVQERDRIGRVTTAGRWVWKHELRFPIEDLAIGPQGFAAITTNGGQLQIFDPAGEFTIGFTVDPTDPPLLVEAPEGSPPGVTWVTLTRRAQWLRGHNLRGEVVWDRQVPWEGWSLVRLGRFAVIASADGRALAFDGSGAVHGQGSPTEDANSVFATSAEGEILRIARHNVHLIGATIDGRVRWRAVTEHPAGPMAAGAPGAAVMLGKSLAWFKNELGRTTKPGP